MKLTVTKTNVEEAIKCKHRKTSKERKEKPSSHLSKLGLKICSEFMLIEIMVEEKCTTSVRDEIPGL